MAALCIPMGYTKDGLPLSVQIVGKPFDEGSVLRVGDPEPRTRGRPLSIQHQERNPIYVRTS